MPVTLIGAIWGILLVIAVLITLALGILTSILIHSKKIGESEKRFRHLFNKVFDVLLLIDDKDRIVDVNESAERLLGYAKKDLLKSRLEDYIPEEGWTLLQSEFEKVRSSGQEFLGETHLICKDKEDLIIAEVGGTLININGQIYILGSFRDISERRHAEESLKRKNVALREVLTHLEEEKLKIKKDVASTVDQTLLPALQKLIQKDGELDSNYYNSLMKNLQELSISTGGMLHVYSKLTPREIEICNLIRGGATSKDIAETLHISEATINKHRWRIRNKLNIANRDINLISYLKNLE